MRDKPARILTFVFLIAMAPACSPTLPSATTAPQPSRLPTRRPAIATVEEPEHNVRPTAADTPTPTPVPPGLPAPLYVLEEEGSVWRLDPDRSPLARVTPPEDHIVSFDVSPSDGTLAYATYDGALFIIEKGLPPRQLISAPDPISVGGFTPHGVALSPSLDTLAYSLGYGGGLEGVDEEIQPDVASQAGVWLLDLATGTRQKLLSQDYPTPGSFPYGHDDVYGHVYGHPRWSPDSLGLILTVGYYENWDVAWIYPISLANSPQALHDPTDSYASASWITGGAELLLYGRPYEDVSDLNVVSNSGSGLMQLIDGDSQWAQITWAGPFGDQIAFVAQFAPDSESQLYIAQLSPTGFSYSPAGFDRPCDFRTVEVAPRGEMALVRCSDRLFLISLDGEIDLDVTSLLTSRMVSPLSKLSFRWGPPQD